MPGDESNEAAITFSPRPYFSRNPPLSVAITAKAQVVLIQTLRSEEKGMPDKVRNCD